MAAEATDTLPHALRVDETDGAERARVADAPPTPKVALQTSRAYACSPIRIHPLSRPKRN